MNDEPRKNPDNPDNTDRTQEGTERVSGEGNYEASRRYRRAVEAFARSGRVDPAARDAAEVEPAEAASLEQAEDEGRSHSAGEDPQLRDDSGR